MAYFEAHAKRCLGIRSSGRPALVARRLLGWLRRRPGATAFTRTQTFLQLKDRRAGRSSDALAPAFAMLADQNYLWPLPTDRGGRPGPAAEVLAVNPSWSRDAPADATP